MVQLILHAVGTAVNVVLVSLIVLCVKAKFHLKVTDCNMSVSLIFLW